MGYIPSLQLYGIPLFLILTAKNLYRLYKKGLTAGTKGYSMGIVSELFLEFVVIYSAAFILNIIINNG